MDDDKPAEARAPRVGLRPVAPADAEFLLDVYADSRADEMALVNFWTDEQKRAFLRSQLDAQRGEYEARFPAADYQIILVEGERAGRLWVARTAEQIRLLDIAILARFRNRGVGTLLVRALMDEAAERKLPLRHFVFQLNADALRFYERLGFRQTGEFQGYLMMEFAPGAASDPPTGG
jgi:ribosomal protein S18 acetylase RimI-like enzyme